MTDKATLELNGKKYDLPVRIGTENEVGIDVQKLRSDSGAITFDPGYGNTGSCESAITFIDGDKGILRYRGYPIEQLAEKSTFIETAWLLIFGELPQPAELAHFREMLIEHEMIHENLRHHFDGFPPDAHPMAILSAMVNAVGCFQRRVVEPDKAESFAKTAARLMSKVRTIAAASYKKSIGRPIMYPKPELAYTANFLHMLFSRPNKEYEPDPAIVRALDQIFILHADHEQNCSTSTVRMVASSQASLWASVSAGVCALWGPLHGGANQAVIEMLTSLQENGESLESFIAKVKDKHAHERLMGFGHRVYKSFDPRAQIIKKACDDVLAKLGIKDPLLDMAKRMEEIALKDPYFIERKLYPNVDFYSGIIMKAIGIPVEMFTVIFAIGRIPGWIANWRESSIDPKARISRPRQLYTGPRKRDYVPEAARR